MARRRSRSRSRSRPRPRPRSAETEASEPITPLLEVDEIAERIETVLEYSPADETEVVWLEVRRGAARRQNKSVDLTLQPERTVLVRVLDLGRVGSFRTGASEVGQLSDAVRFAMAQSRVREPLPGLPHLPADLTPLVESTSLFDPEIAKMSPKKMRSWLLSLPARNHSLRTTWTHARVLVFNSRKVRRTVETTAIGFEIRTGRRPGAGHSLDASRQFHSLDAKTLIERAQSRHAAGEPAELPPGPLPVLLSPAATIELVDLLSQTSFSAKSYYDGTSFLREHINIQVFDRRFHLKDDGTDPRGLPFPFDLEGTPKHPVDLIRDGAPKTPTLDQRQAAVLGLPPTAHAIGGNNARAENLFLMPGTDSTEDLLAAASDGLFVGWLDHVECSEPKRVGFRARARGVRLIQHGKLGAGVPDFIWEDSLLRVFSALAGLGADTSRRLGADGYSGGISAPPVALSSVTPKR
ncbi:MAG: hypothetical protein IH936_03735 [Acidobacteria bacterium]|nr:hypothetical protein [Acidobacteriota bacterium]